MPFFVREILPSSDESDALKKIFEIKDRLSRVAVIDMRGDKAGELSQGKVEVISYNENRLVLKTRNAGDGYLVVTNNYYPTWKVTLDGKKQPYFQTDYAFMGLFVPRGEHIIEVKM